MVYGFRVRGYIIVAGSVEERDPKDLVFDGPEMSGFGLRCDPKGSITFLQNKCPPMFGVRRA